ncbi:MAG TPA: ATP-binding cassette domain-containing protein [Anaerolineaceae bacterium]|jgi:ABC-2 type transport system ATP-binding protein|nr:ATP-binding cassette domain-containing protein [Anaerolineaceae bacterium]
MRYFVIKAEKVTKKYSHRPGIENITFEVEPGEIFGLLGNDHAGKSTLVSLLAGYFRPNSGHLMVFGLDSQRESRQIRERSGFFPGNYPAPSRHTVAELLRSQGHQLGGMLWTDIQKLTDQLDLDLAQPAATLSSHDRQVFDLLQAFIPRPELLVLDEPTYELKPAIQDVFYRLISEARQDGRTVFLTSRSLAEMERICDRVAIMHRGKLVAVERGIQLRSRAIRVVEMRFADSISKDGFADIPNIRNLTIEGNKLRCVLQGEPDRLIKTACQHHITDLLSTQPSLEQVLADTYGIKTI